MNYKIAWWNLENLFDLEDSLDRPDWLQKQLSKELKGWDEEVLEQKVSQLVKIINQIDPDILGVCEVENKPVMDRLSQALNQSGRIYQVAHHDTQDGRGIDIAFLYDGDKFEAEKQFSHFILKRAATRDLFQVNFKTRDGGQDLILVGNHWPSRKGGQLESEPYRIVAAETLSYWMERIMEEKEEQVALICMGDFNDEPFNRSLTDYALAGNSLTKVLNSESAPRLYNLMWKFLGEGIGTLYFQNFPNVLDQFLLSKGLLSGQGAFRCLEDSVQIEIFEEMKSGGIYPAPIKFGRPSEKGFNPRGFSDHYPVSLQLERV
ncbi:MAG: hypothetical protein SFT81_04835 [Candidatus Caenarcaniphilales bacterium]|nr:hypothetical protein [Candidatus Caenarcaniphilales bacterium]